MKKIFRNSRIIALAFLTLFSAASTHASDSSGVIASELKFAGMIKNDPLFELHISGGPGNDEYIISIADNQGNNLYRENIKAEIFSKKFLLNAGELGDETLTFEIISRKTRQVVRYEVSSKSRYVQETTVSLLK